MITLFTSKTCKYCPEVKKFLEDNNVKFTVASVEDAINRETLLNLGGRGVPAITTHAGTLIVGKDDIIAHIKRYEL